MTGNQPNVHLTFMGPQAGLPHTVEQGEHCSTPENAIHAEYWCRGPGVVSHNGSALGEEITREYRTRTEKEIQI